MSNRRLSLHVSALSDDEYAQYTAVLDDLAPDDDDLSVRETRAWLKGRYPDAPVDDVLRLFSPGMKAGDTLTRGQFYAAMRLLMHAQTQGNEVDRSLAFVQPRLAHPNLNSKPTSPTTSYSVQSQPSTVQVPSPSKPTFTASQSATSSTNPFSPAHRPNNPFAITSRSGSTSPTRRPFSPPLPSPSRQPAPPVHPSSLPPSRSLPARSTSHTHLPPSRPGSTSPTRDAPSLPPRKPQTIPTPPPPRRPPALPPKPKSHTSTLMKQSIQASKTGSAMKRAEGQLERERVMQVLKSSSGHNGIISSTHKTESTSSGSVASSSSGSGSGRNALPSPPISATSLEQVALAKPKPKAPPPRHPALSEDGTSTPKPPRHPALSEDGVFVRGTVGRSRSVHYPTPPNLSARKRPESVQVLMGELNGGESVSGGGGGGGGRLGLSRHASLGPQLQRRLGKLMKSHGEEKEGLMEDERRGKGDWASRGSFDWDDAQTPTADGQTPTAEHTRDSLKWPMQEGEVWQRL